MLDTDCDHVDACTGCGCSECGALDRALGPLLLVSGRTVQACAECRGVPEEVEEAATVRLEQDPTIKATGAEWAEKLSQEVG